MKKFETWLFSIVVGLSVISACFALGHRDWFKLLSECTTVLVFAGMALVAYRNDEANKTAKCLLISGLVLGAINLVWVIDTGSYSRISGCVLLLVLSVLYLVNVYWCMSGKGEEDK